VSERGVVLLPRKKNIKLLKFSDLGQAFFLWKKKAFCSRGDELKSVTIKWLTPGGKRSSFGL
jgi:hypothetical protein